MSLITHRSKKIEKILGNLFKNPELLSVPVKSESRESYSPLWEALLDGSEEIIELLIEFEIDVNKWYVNFDGEQRIPIFHWLADSYDWTSKVKIAEVLIRLGADVNITDDKLVTPLQLALNMGNIQCVEFLLKNGARLGDSGSVVKSLKPELTHYKELLLLLLEHGLDTRYVNEDGKNLLHIIVCLENFMADRLEVVEILLNAGVPLNEADHHGYSPLHDAIDRQNVELVSFFIDKGADVNKYNNKDEFLPLCLAAVYEGNVDIVNLLLSKGAKINSACHFGWTALHTACIFQCSEMISIFLRNGADISARNKNGFTPFSLLTFDDNSCHTCVVNMIKEFSRLSFENLSIDNDDMKLIQSDPKLQKCFEDCKNELFEMSRMKFYPPYSFYSVLKMSKNTKKLANLLKNEDFEKKFKANLSFLYFESDLKRIFDEATKVRNDFITVSFRLKNLFREFLPDEVLKKIGENMTVEDLPCEG